MTPVDVNDRRHFQREPLLLPLEISCAPQLSKWEPAWMLDASPGGILLSLPERSEFQPDMSVNLRLLFGSNSSLALGAGVIRHAAAQDDRKVFGVGLSENSPFFSRVSMLGISPQILEIKSLLPQVAGSGLNVLIRGETGAGKNILAKLIHDVRCGEERPFIRVNCPSIPEQLFESELFGHEKGAYTDAKTSAPGFFRLAGEGTILLDEISEIHPHLQAKLLSVIEEKKFISVGGQKQIPVKANIIATTNLDLEKAVREGRFRRDLYYRLSEMPIHLPPLRERKEDIPVLAHHFLLSHCEKYQRPLQMLAESDMEQLKGYSWPGNIRELENCLKQTALLGRFVGPAGSATEVLTVAEKPEGLHDLFDDLFAESTPLPELTKRATEKLERFMIFRTLKDCRDNRTCAANQLGISYRTLLRKLEQFNYSTS